MSAISGTHGTDELVGDPHISGPPKPSAAAIPV
jgi:hypothetical protein